MTDAEEGQTQVMYAFYHERCARVCEREPCARWCIYAYVISVANSRLCETIPMLALQLGEKGLFLRALWKTN